MHDISCMTHRLAFCFFARVTASRMLGALIQGVASLAGLDFLELLQQRGSDAVQVARHGLALRFQAQPGFPPASWLGL